jgi:hypothetical protein
MVRILTSNAEDVDPDARAPHATVPAGTDAVTLQP